MMKPRTPILKGLLITAVFGLGFIVIGGQGLFAETSENGTYDGSTSMNPTEFTERARLTSGASGDRFGCSVAISGNTIVVGAVTDTVGTNTAQGSAYVFVREGGIWSEQAKIVAPDGLTRYYFGYRVALDGDTGGISLQETFGSMSQAGPFS